MFCISWVWSDCTQVAHYGTCYFQLFPAWLAKVPNWGPFWRGRTVNNDCIPVAFQYVIVPRRWYSSCVQTLLGTSILLRILSPCTVGFLRGTRAYFALIHRSLQNEQAVKPLEVHPRSKWSWVWYSLMNNHVTCTLQNLPLLPLMRWKIDCDGSCITSIVYSGANKECAQVIKYTQTNYWP